MNKIKGKIEKITRLNCSVNGNPRYTLKLENSDKVFTTKSDYSYCYNVENLYRNGGIVEIEYYETKTSFRIETLKKV